MPLPCVEPLLLPCVEPLPLVATVTFVGIETVSTRSVFATVALAPTVGNVSLLLTLLLNMAGFVLMASNRFWAAFASATSTTTSYCNRYVVAKRLGSSPKRRLALDTVTAFASIPMSSAMAICVANQT